MTFKLTSFKIVDNDNQYLYSTKFENKLFDWIEDICVQGRPKDLDDAIEMVEFSKWHLITKGKRS